MMWGMPPAPLDTEPLGVNGLRKPSVLPGLLWPRRPAVTASVEAERGLATVFLLLRGAIGVQIVLGVIGEGLGSATHPLAYAVVSAATLAWVIASLWATWRGERILPGWWGPADVAVTVAAIAGCAFTLPEHLVVGTWASWAPGLATGTAAALGVWCRNGRVALGLAVMIGAVYAVLAATRSNADKTTVIGNSLTYVIFTLTATIFATYWRRLAESTDAATALAVRAAEKVQTDRYRLLVHDLGTVLRLLADESTPASMLPGLRVQAASESNRLAAYLKDTAGEPTRNTRPLTLSAPTPTLGQVVADAIDGFTDLPLDVMLDLGGDQPIPAPAGAALGAAVRTLLHNVRVHAHATEVTVHTDATAQQWELSVADNGQGFSVDPNQFGFGLRHQVITELHTHNIDTSIRSAPGEGCTVTLTGARDNAAASPRSR